MRRQIECVICHVVFTQRSQWHAKYCSNACLAKAKTVTRPEQLVQLLNQGLDQTEVAARLGVARSTVLRSIERYGIKKVWTL